MTHPLSGANIQTLASVARASGGPARDKLLPFLGICAAVAARTPFSWAERLVLAPLLPALSEMPAPIFILGHWRSGTTHLYNVMSTGEFGFVPPVATGLPWDFIGLGRLLRPVVERVLPPDRYIDAIPVHPDSPQEDEIALASMTPVSFYHGLYFPEKFDLHLRRGLFQRDCSEAERSSRWRAFSYFLRKLSYHQDRPLLIKNPVYTGCVADIRAIFPDARFIHIHRNPFDVFLSMRNFYRRLLPVFALQDHDRVDIERTVLSVYVEMMHRYERDTADLGPASLIELGYDELDRTPLPALRRIYDQLGLDGYEAAEPRFQRYLQSVESYRKNTFKGTAETVEAVEREWGYFIEKWGYRKPEVAAV